MPKLQFIKLHSDFIFKQLYAVAVKVKNKVKNISAIQIETLSEKQEW